MVKLRRSRNGKGWEYSIIFRWPDGTRYLERRDAPVPSKSGAQRWCEAREASLLAGGKAALAIVEPVKVVTLGDFWPRFMRDHYGANRNKPSTVDAADSIHRMHLACFDDRPLDKITTADVAALKGSLAKHSAKTANNVLSVLSRALGAAVEWGDINVMPCKVSLLPTVRTAMQWYELAEYQRLVAAAARLGTGHHVLVLLAGSAGLRRGEIRALKWSDLDLARRLIKVDRALWRAEENTPKGNRGRIVPMTPELADALKRHKHLRGERVLYSEKGRELSNRTVRNWIATAIRRAGLAVPTTPTAPARPPKGSFDAPPCQKCKGTLRRPVKRGPVMTSLCVACERRRRDASKGAIHILRHTFCSHLAAAGAPAKAIQELAGHADISTTQRYMHLSPGDRNAAMGALAGYYAAPQDRGAVVEQAPQTPLTLHSVS